MELAINSLNHELEAMAAVGRLLGDLDAAARQRVLRWATERYAAEAAPAEPVVADLAVPAALWASPMPVAAPAVAPDDPALAIDSLSEMFVVHASEVDDDLGEFGIAEVAPVRVPDTAKLPLETVLRSFAADFRRLADEWNGAAA